MLRQSSGNGKKIEFTAGFPPGWRTKTHNRYISKDKSLLAWLEDCMRGTDSGLSFVP